MDQYIEPIELDRFAAHVEVLKQERDDGYENEYKVLILIFCYFYYIITSVTEDVHGNYCRLLVQYLKERLLLQRNLKI